MTKLYIFLKKKIIYNNKKEDKKICLTDDNWQANKQTNALTKVY